MLFRLLLVGVVPVVVYVRLPRQAARLLEEEGHARVDPLGGIRLHRRWMLGQKVGSGY
jgi:hypothetical protein